MKKRIIYLLLVSVLVWTLSGCGAKKDDGKASVDTEQKPTKDVSTDISSTVENKDASQTGKIKKEEKPQVNTGDTSKKDEQNEAFEMYSALLDEFYHIISDYSEDLFLNYEGEDKLGLLERLRFYEPGDYSEQFGYVIEDFSGDGIPELIISDLEVDETGQYQSRSILNLYSIADNQVNSIIESFTRDRHYHLGDGKFYNEGSAGAMYYIMSVYKLSRDGQNTEEIDFYFTNLKEGTDEMGYYHNKVGTLDLQVSEELKISEEEFWDIGKKLFAQTQPMKFQSFADYYPGKHSSLPLGIAYSKKSELDYDFDYDSFRVEDEKYPVKATLYAKKNYTDFKVLELSYEDVDAQGNPKFKSKVVYETPEFPAARPFLLGLEFLGDMPSNGISFVDEKGKTRKFMIYQSGKDGSLIISEF